MIEALVCAVEMDAEFLVAAEIGRLGMGLDRIRNQSAIGTDNGALDGAIWDRGVIARPGIKVELGGLGAAHSGRNGVHHARHVSEALRDLVLEHRYIVGGLHPRVVDRGLPQVEDGTDNDAPHRHEKAKQNDDNPELEGFRPAAWIILGWHGHLTGLKDSAISNMAPVNTLFVNSQRPAAPATLSPAIPAPR